MKRKTRSGLVWLLVLSLLISTAASTVAVAGRIRYYTAVVDVKSMIPLVPEHITLEDLRASAGTANLSSRRFGAINTTLCAPNETLFTVSDDNGVWNGNTRVDIFKSEYRNGQNNITVAGNNGDKVIAPGTENAYTFKLKNNYTVPMDYTVTVKAYCTPDTVAIPVICRLSRYDGKWIAGDAANWKSVPDFDGAHDAAKLAAESYVTYTLDWQWPFDGDDTLDTALGTLAMQQDLTLTIEIITTAEADFVDPRPDPTPTPTPKPTPGPTATPDPIPTPDPTPEPTPTPDPDDPDVGEPLPPKTGDNSNPVLWLTLAAVSFVLLILLIFQKDKDGKQSPAEAKNREKD